MFNGFSKKELFQLMIKKPYFAQIELTRNCNFACKFCFENCNNKKKYIDNSFEKWKTVIDKLYSIGIKYLHFSGGENFLYKDFKKILEYSKNKKFNILINTNGSFDITEISKYVDDFVFSVHGLNEIHDSIVGVNGAFKLVEKNIEKAYKLNKNVVINSVLIKENFNDFEEIFLYFKKKYPNIKYAPTFAIPCKTGTKFDQSIIPLNKNILKIFNDTLTKLGEENVVYKHGFYGLQDSTRNNSNFNLPVCAAGKSKLIIKYNGNVYPCNFFQTDEYLCGNIFTDDIYNIWKNGKGFNLFRKLLFEEIVPSKCKECKKKINCFSGCKAWTKSYINNDVNLKCEGDERCEIMDAFVRNRNNN